MPSASKDPESVLNEFLRCYLEDVDAARERTLADYRAHFAGHELLIEAELAALSGEHDEVADLDEGQIRSAPLEPAADGSRAMPSSGSSGERFGPYLLVRVLGQGGQGLVWLAHDTRLDRLVALKLLTALAALSPLALKRFLREAKAAARLSDPGICAIHETGSEHGVHFIAMRYIEGESLATLLDEARQRTADEYPSRLALPTGRDVAEPTSAQEHVLRVVLLFERLARSLHLAHEAGIVHRDIKPGNVMVARDGHPVLLDFGLAGVLDENLPSFTRTGDVFGTPAYMAPEQIAPTKEGDNPRVDRRTDVYALGATLYECLVLRHPFESATRAALYQAIREEDPPDPRKTNPAIEADLWTILQTALAKERTRRYATALELAEDLRRVREAEPISAHPPSRRYKVGRFVRRHRVLASALLIALVALATSTAVATTGLFRARQAKDRATAAAESEGRLRIEAEDSAAEATAQRVIAQDRELVSRRSAYASQMQFAFTAWENRNLQRVIELLRAQLPQLGQADMRGFEWYCLWKMCHPGILARHRDSAGGHNVALAVTSDGASYLTLDDKGRALRRSIQDGTILSETALHGSPEPYLACFSGDGGRLAVFDRVRAMVDVWDTGLWSHVRSLDVSSSGALRLILSDDGRLLAFVDDCYSLIVVDIERGIQVVERHTGLANVYRLAFRPDASVVAIGGDEHGVEGSLVGVVLVIDVQHGTVIGRAQIPGVVIALDYSFDGKRLAVGGHDWRVRILDGECAREMGLLEGHQGGIGAVVFSPNGGLATSGSADGTLRFWDVDQCKEQFAVRAQAVPQCIFMSFTADGDRLLTSEWLDSSVLVWSAAVKSPPLTVVAPLEAPHSYSSLSLLTFSPDSRTLAMNARTGELALLDVESRTVRATLESGERVTCASYSSNGATVLVGTQSGQLAMWDAAATGVLARRVAHEGQVNDLAFAPDGHLVASVGSDGRVALWGASTLESRGSHPLGADEVHGVLFDRDGSSVWSVGQGMAVMRWIPGVGLDHTYERPNLYYEMIRAPDGTSVAMVPSGWPLELRDSSLSQVRRRFEGHAGGTYRAIAFAPDGRTLATGSVDKTVKLWQVETGQELCTLKFANHVHSLAFSPDGRWLATWSCDGVLKLWPAATPDEVPW